MSVAEDPTTTIDASETSPKGNGSKKDVFLGPDWEVTIRRIASIGFVAEAYFVEAFVRAAGKGASALRSQMPQDFEGIISYVGAGGSGGPDLIKKLKQAKKFKNLASKNKFKRLLDGRRKHMRELKKLRQSGSIEVVQEARGLADGLQNTLPDEWHDILGCDNRLLRDFGGGGGQVKVSARLVVVDLEASLTRFAKSGYVPDVDANAPSWWSAVATDWLDIIPGAEIAMHSGVWKVLPLEEHIVDAGAWVGQQIDRAAALVDEMIAELQRTDPWPSADVGVQSKQVGPDLYMTTDPSRMP